MLKIVSLTPSALVIKSVAAGLPVAADVGLFVPVNCAVPAILGDVRVGELASTKLPLPVSSVTAAARLAEVGVARKVAMPEPRPDTLLVIETLVIVLLAPSIVLFVSVDVPLAVTNPPPVFAVAANAVVTPVPNAAPLKLDIITCFVNVILAPAFKLLSAALVARTDDVACVIAMFLDYLFYLTYVSFLNMK
jgi:hypothetical protein